MPAARSPGLKVRTPAFQAGGIGFKSHLPQLKSLVNTRLFIFCVAFRVAWLKNVHSSCR